MTKMKLSKRLELIAKMVPNNIPCADIGSDHGLLVKYLIENQIVNSAYASDNKIGPFNRLKDNLRSLIEQNKIEVSLQDGLNNLPNKYRSVIIAGMGGELILRIIKNNIELIENIDYFLLAPHGKEKELREFLVNSGYKIIDENIIFEGHFYEVILFEKGNANYSDFEIKYGPINLIKKSTDFLNKYQTRIKSNLEILVNPYLDVSRRIEIEKVIEDDQKLIEFILK